MIKDFGYQIPIWRCCPKYIPLFLNSYKFTKEECISTAEKARNRIHIEHIVLQELSNTKFLIILPKKLNMLTPLKNPLINKRIINEFVQVFITIISQIYQLIFIMFCFTAAKLICWFTRLLRWYSNKLIVYYII